MGLVGCAARVYQGGVDAKSAKKGGASSVACLTHYYVGTFGDDRNDWDGTFYLKENLSIVAHLPSRSEFYIRVMRAIPHQAGLRNLPEIISSQIKERAHGKGGTVSKTTIAQRISMHGQDGGSLNAAKDFEYVKSEFNGRRLDTDRYSRSDRVQVTTYVTCLTCDSNLSDKSLYFIAIAMIPLEVPDDERKRLGNVLEKFLETVVLFQD